MTTHAPRLHVPTLMRVIGECRFMLELYVSIEGQHVGDRAPMTAATKAIITECNRLAAEAARQAPTLSDWVAICDDSRFGPAEPQVFDGVSFGVRLARGVNVIIRDTDGAQVLGNGTVPDAWCGSPAELKVALGGAA